MTKKQKIDKTAAGETPGANEKIEETEVTEETEAAVKESTEAAETAENPEKPESEAETEEVSAEDAFIAENEELKTELESVQAELAETADRLLRLQAEFDNFRRRTAKEKEDLRQTANGDLLASLLPVLDNFDRALAHAEDSPILEGIVMVQKQFWDILNREGLEKAGAEGEVFDPKFHDAVMQEPCEGTESGVILQVLQPGYKYKDRLLRAAMVKVSQ